MLGRLVPGWGAGVGTLGLGWWQLLTHVVSAVLPRSRLPKTAAGSSCWAQLAPGAEGHVLGIPGAAGPISKGRGSARKKLWGC